VTWLITGGAGYIGSHVVRAFREEGRSVVVLDDFTTGVRERLPREVPVVCGSVLDTRLVEATIREHGVVGVVHLAAKKAVAESVHHPLYYYRENVGGFGSLLEAIAGTGVDRLLLSSSAAVYGSPDADFVGEDAPKSPTNPYGTSKLVCEWMLRDVGLASGLKWSSLRYFNVAGT
jgi:UDP-glucose 4-epimerase